VVQADGEYRALCERLEKLKPQHPDLRGCIAWVDAFPEDLCTTAYVAPAPPPDADPTDPMVRQFALIEHIQHPCHWQFYLGERMDTHTNRHFTLAIDPTRRQVIGATDTAGHPTPGDLWRRGPQLRQALEARLAREAAVKKRCAGASDCPDVPHFGTACEEPHCFSVHLPRAEGEVEVVDLETDPAGTPKQVYVGDEKTAFADWLTSLAP
ncbi:MAG: hypothetical protein KC731_19625, partial [Myxococcales bacterium]|nr:hypothetical protein [Myxococcales bacterium]